MSNTSGVDAERKERKKQRNKEYREANKQRNKEYREANKQRVKQRNKEYREANKQRVKQRAKEYREANKERLKEYREVNKERVNQYAKEYQKQRRATDPCFKLALTIRKHLYRSIKGGAVKEYSSVLYLGCTIEQLKLHLESQFQPGMTWDNWSATGWHIDHVRPLASFDLTDPEQLKQACHYSNLQPLRAEDNLTKGARTQASY